MKFRNSKTVFRIIFSVSFCLLGTLVSEISAQALPPHFNLTAIGHLSFAPRTLAGCTHYVDMNGGEWALVGTSEGMSIVDVNDPTHPVERFSVPGLNSTWRELRTWNGYAYVGSEADSSGITIVNLQELPDTITWKTWFGDGNYENQLRRSHTVQTKDGYLYIFGGGNVTNGCTIASLDDPWNPVIVGTYTNNYVHDGFIRNDTLWTSEIYSGWFGVVDISDRSNPVLITTQPTPGTYSHNIELSDDSHTLFAADEKVNAPMASFDVSDLENITLLDTYRPGRRPTGEVHNVRVKGNFVVNPSYQGQLTIVDATRPDNLIETAWDSLGNSLVWDADPYLPSGVLFATAKMEGLYLYMPTYYPAAWLEGNVTDAETGLPLSNALVEVYTTSNSGQSDAQGIYKTGAASAGVYILIVSRDGYYTTVLSGVSLTAGQVTQLNIQLTPVAVATEDTGMEDAIQIAPTVFSEFIHINIPPGNRFTAQGALVRLVNAQGQKVVEEIIKSHSFSLQNLSALPTGNYFLTLWHGNTCSKATKLVKY